MCGGVTKRSEVRGQRWEGGVQRKNCEEEGRGGGSLTGDGGCVVGGVRPQVLGSLGGGLGETLGTPAVTHTGGDGGEEGERDIQILCTDEDGAQFSISSHFHFANTAGVAPTHSITEWDKVTVMPSHWSVRTNKAFFCLTSTIIGRRINKWTLSLGASYSTANHRPASQAATTVIFCWQLNSPPEN